MLEWKSVGFSTSAPMDGKIRYDYRFFGTGRIQKLVIFEFSSTGVISTVKRA